MGASLLDEDLRAAREAYERDGVFVFSRPVLPPDVVLGACAGMDALMRGEYATGVPPQPSVWNPGDDPHKLVKIEMPQVADARIRALVAHPAVGRLAAALTGARFVQVWWVQMLVKPADAPDGPSPHVGWHQDRQYWGAWEEGSELFTAWVACSDVTADAGPVLYVRGSQRLGLLGQGDFFAPDAERQRQGIRLPGGAAWDEVAGVLPPGGVSFHDQLTLHGSTANRSGRPRRSFALHLRTERSRPAGDRREGLTRFIDDESYCPVIHRAESTA
jgi:ectoine hydroxylase-related dioxygenase (phytanoyl-CoA dioxygenase family)